MRETVERREAGFWDNRARSLDGDDLRTQHDVLGREPLFQFLEERVRVARPGDLLDAGCGPGVGTVRFGAHAGFAVGADVAVLTLEAARAYAARTDARNAAFVAASCEQLPFRGGSLDMVVGNLVLHHLPDKAAAAAEIHRVLKPGGIAFFAETWGANPLLRLARAAVGLAGLREGTRDEKPLRRADVEVLSAPFASHAVHYPSLDLFKFVNGILLRVYRKWNRYHLVRAAVDLVWPLADRFDGFLYRRCPFLRPYGWHVVLELRRRS